MMSGKVRRESPHTMVSVGKSSLSLTDSKVGAPSVDYLVSAGGLEYKLVICSLSPFPGEN